MTVNLRLAFVGMLKNIPLMLMLLGTLVSIAAYFQAIDSPFINDDNPYVVENIKLSSLNIFELWRLFTEPYNPYEFLPLRDLSYWLDISLFGLNSSAFRLHNIALYLLCIPLVYSITLKLWRYFRPMDGENTPLAAALVTVLFVVNPSHVEAVVWVSGRKDLLSAMFSLLAIWFALKSKRESGLSQNYAIVTLVALLAAMLSKASAITVAPVIGMLWVMFWRDQPKQERRQIFLLWPLASLLLAGAILAVFMGSSSAKATAYFGVEAITRMLAVVGWLVRLAVSPENRHFIYPVFADPYLPLMVTLGAAACIVVVSSLFVTLRKRSLSGFALISFFLFCLPYIQVIPFQTHSLVSDRFLNLAVWPAALLIVALSWRLRSRYRNLFLFSLILLWGFQTVERSRDWRTYEELLEADVKEYPGYYLSSYNKITLDYLPKNRYLEARELANKIDTPEEREIVIKLVGIAEKLGEVLVTNYPRESMSMLLNLEPLLIRPPEQINWDPAMNYFWRDCQNSFVNEWQWLVKNFPDQASVRSNAKISIVNIMNANNALAGPNNVGIVRNSHAY